VTFNDHQGSTKSYAYVKEHDLALHELDYVPVLQDDIAVENRGRRSDGRGGCTTDPTCGSASWAASTIPTNRLAALAAIEDAESKGEVLTGVLYVNTGKPTFLDLLNLPAEPIATLPESRVRPSRAVLEEVMEELR
jgi:2-oxoglutarate ferredoxin oxidoreductase subunit beta